MPHRTLYRAHLGLLTRTFLPTAGAIIGTDGAPKEADVVRRTIPGNSLPEWPAGVDHFALARMAHEARTEYLRDAYARWGRAIRQLFQRGTLASLANRFWDALEAAERSRRDAWLARSTDVCELEQRIRMLERQAVRGTW